MTVRIVARTVAAVAMLVGGWAIGAGSWTGSSAFAASPGCANYQLLMRPIASNGAAGHISLMFRIHDLLPGSCTLFGYPGAMLLDRNFNTLPTQVTRAPYPAGGPGPKLVTLTRRHDAYFVLGWEDVPTPGETCPRSGSVMLWAPNDRLPVVAYAAMGACGGKLTASPVAATTFWNCTGSCGLKSE